MPGAWCLVPQAHIPLGHSLVDELQGFDQMLHSTPSSVRFFPSRDPAFVQGWGQHRCASFALLTEGACVK